MKKIISIITLITLATSSGFATNPGPIAFSRVFDEPSKDSKEMVLKINDEHSRVVHVDRNVALDYRDIKSATLSESRNGSPMIELIFTTKGKEKLSKLTTECLGKAIAIQVEGELYSAPIVMNPITGGKAQVTGSFSRDFAEQFISKLNAMVGDGLLFASEDHTFTAIVSDVRLSSILVEDGKSRDDTVSVHVKAVIFEEPLIIADVRVATQNANLEVNSIINYYKTLMSKPASEVLQLWHADDRKAKEHEISDETLKHMRGYFEKNPTLSVLGVIYQDSTSSVLVEMGDFVVGFNLRESEGKLLLTDHPSNDLELAIIEASFKNKN